MDKDWMTVEAAAEYLQISMTTAYRWTKEGRLPSHRIGRLLRYRKDEIDAAVKSQDVE